MRLGLREKLIASFAIIIVLNSVLGGIIYTNVSNTTSNVKEIVDSSTEAAQSIKTLRSDFSSLLAAQEKDRESFRVLEYARATFTPVAPNWLRVLMVITMIGVGTFVGIIALFDHFDDSLRSVEEAKEMLKKPLLGTVPKLNEYSGNGLSSIRKVLLKTIGKS